MDNWGMFRPSASHRMRAPRPREYRRADGQASLNAAIAGIRESAQDRADAIRAEADAAAAAVLHEAEAEVARLEAEWAIATHHAEAARLLKPKQAADLVGVGVHVIYELLRDGTLPTIQIGTRRYIHRAILEEYVDGLAGLLDPAARSLIAAARPPVDTTVTSVPTPHEGTHPSAKEESNASATADSSISRDHLQDMTEALAGKFKLVRKPNQSGAQDDWYEGSYLRMLYDRMLHRVQIANELDLSGPQLAIEDDGTGHIRIELSENASSLLIEVAAYASARVEGDVQ